MSDWNPQDEESRFAELLGAADRHASPCDAGLLEKIKQQSARAYMAGHADRQKRSGLPRRIFMTLSNRRFFPVSLAACLLAGAIIAFVLVGPGGNQSIAWADVAKVVQDARYTVFNVSITQSDTAPLTARAFCKAPGRLRWETDEMVYVFDFTGGKPVVLCLVPQAKYASTTTMEGVDTANLYGYDWLAELKGIIGSKDAEYIGEKTLGGVVCRGWSVFTGGRIGCRSVAVWADAGTGRLVRVVLEMGNMTQIMEGFEFPAMLDDALFSMTPPEGYTSQRVQVDVNSMSVQDVATVLRIWGGGNGGIFPNARDFPDPIVFRNTARNFDWISNPVGDFTQMTHTIAQGFVFLNVNGTWAYSGEGVRVGDADAIIFWCKAKPDDLEYTVLYGDLSIGRVGADQLPGAE